MSAILMVSAGVAILLIGGGIGFWAGRSGVGGSKARVESAEAELKEYKENVTEHFGQTAAHFQAIGKQYRELYEHMSDGAQVLCEPDEAGKLLPFAPGVDAASSDVEKPSAETVAEAEVHAPIDYPEQPAANEVADNLEAAEELAVEQHAEIADNAEAAETDVPEGSISESDAETQPGAKVGEQTLH